MTADQAAEVGRLRRRIAEMSGRAGESAAPAAAVTEAEGSALAVPAPLGGLFAAGGLARGTVATVAGARSLLLSLVAAASRAGATVAIVGIPELNLLAGAELGAELGRVALIPEPGDDPAQVAGVLLDGIDLVVLGMRGAAVAPSRARVLTGRVRRQRSVLLVADGHWPQAQTRLDGRVIGHRHVPDRRSIALASARSGYGRVGGIALRVSVADRGRPEQVVDLLLQDGTGGRMELLAAPADPAVRLAVAN